jgi:sulfate transport system substrate-binding protein
MVKLFFRAAVLGLVLGSVLTLSAAEPAKSDKPVELLSAADSHGKELWQEINERFSAHHNGSNGPSIRIREAAGGWSAQLDAVVTKKLDADVVTLGLGTDVDAIHRAGLLANDWEYRLPHHSVPYTSPIVIVVPKGNPQHIKDWADLAKSDIQIVTGDPKKSRTAQFAFLGAYGSVLQRGGSDAEARELLSKLARQTRLPAPTPAAKPAENAAPKAGEAAQAPNLLVPKADNEVTLIWEKEAIDAIEATKGKVEIVYPSITIRTGPEVAVIDANVDAKGTRSAAETYLRFLFSDEAQEIIAKNHYRPVRNAGLKSSVPALPRVEQFGLNDLARDGRALREKLFGENGLFDQARAKK